MKENTGVLTQSSLDTKGNPPTSEVLTGRHQLGLELLGR